MKLGPAPYPYLKADVTAVHKTTRLLQFLASLCLSIGPPLSSLQHLLDDVRRHVLDLAHVSNGTPWTETRMTG